MGLDGWVGDDYEEGWDEIYNITLIQRPCCLLQLDILQCIKE